KNLFSSSAVCSPSRASMVSGRYPSETGVTDVILRGSENGLNLDLKLFPEVFQSNAYSTIMVGKWHLGHKKKEFFPENRGYYRFTGFPVGARRSMSPSIYIDGKWTEAEGEYTSDLLTDYSIDYLRDIDPKKTGKPFLLS